MSHSESPGNGLSANVGLDNLDANHRQICPRISSHADIADRNMWFALLCYARWGSSAPAALHDLTGINTEPDDRSYRRWSSGHNKPSFDVLWLLLRSKEGYLVLKYIMGDDPPDWWRNMQRLLALAAIAEEFFERMTTTK